eukprot:GAFH01002949.1.p1 GENE.GAFH01002949.1~~GAFH01002949.1.p1  ORF type:complete len:279 (-),score=66.02 GAFH01002949.1:101-937(-)
MPLWFLSALYLPILHHTLNTLLTVVGLHEFDNLVVILTGLPQHNILHYGYCSLGLFMPLVAYFTNSYLALRNALDASMILSLVLHLTVVFASKQTRIPKSSLIHLFASFFGLYWVAFSISQSAFILSKDRSYMAILLLTTWASDGFAMIVGRTMGKHRIFAALSPRKTWEGFLGGCIVGAIFPILWMYPLSKIWPAMPQLNLLQYLVPGVCIAFLTQVGDLTQSFLKRAVDVKDSGNFFPGHGGVLDRNCGLFFSAPFLNGYVHGTLLRRLRLVKCMF